MGPQDIGNGQGYLYRVRRNDNTILDIKENNPDGADGFRRLALTNAPLAQNRSAIGHVVITGCNSVGNVTAININGVNQIGGNVGCATSDPVAFAALVAAAISAFAPASEPDYTAYAIDDDISIVSPPDVGASVNDFVITVVVDDVSITSTTTPMTGGSTNQGKFDGTTGFRYFMNANYNGTAAVPDSIVNAIDITGDITKRGMENSLPVQDKTIAADAITTSDRYSIITNYVVDTEGGIASDALVFINPAGFVDGDLIILDGANPSHAVVVESAPVSTSPAPFKNIYLSGNLPITIDAVGKRIILSYKYVPGTGSIFVECARANVALDGVQNFVTYFDTDKTIADYPYAKVNLGNKRFSLANVDIQGSPSYLTNIDALLNLIINTSGQSLISMFPDGLNSGALKLKFIGIVGSLGAWQFEQDVMIYAGASDTKMTAFRNGLILTGPSGSILDVINTPLTQFYVDMGLVSSDLGVKLINQTSIVGPGNISLGSPPHILESKAKVDDISAQFITQVVIEGTVDNTWQLSYRSYQPSSNTTNELKTLMKFISLYASGGSPTYAALIGCVLDVTGYVKPSTFLEAGSYVKATTYVEATTYAKTPKLVMTDFSGTATLIGGEVTITQVGFLNSGADYRLLLSYSPNPATGAMVDAANLGHLYYVFNGLSSDQFKIKSDNVADTNMVHWMIIYAA